LDSIGQTDILNQIWKENAIKYEEHWLAQAQKLRFASRFLPKKKTRAWGILRLKIRVNKRLALWWETNLQKNHCVHFWYQGHNSGFGSCVTRKPSTYLQNHYRSPRLSGCTR
jgi:Zn ribbon nucleic-acid-binding protein